ncbi:MAG: DEAD/DEAH box helicase family protein [Leptospiraceae bacterium]|nr:DEAD/DEAH box helicase family protein [Leptospiraceae bacterium]MDW7976108.1 DEAD/DEAH box helicase family protein [Leptospiraceae bacterium]
MRIFLQNMLQQVDWNSLPLEWSSFDLEFFSSGKRLWDYQQSALKNTIKLLWKYYDDFGGDKSKLFQWYRINGLQENFDIKLSKKNGKLSSLLEEHFEIKNGRIPYSNYINRMGFWMATGSGKTLVIIKLIYILKKLIKLELIPDGDILFLTPRDDLINQFKKILDEFNYSEREKIELRDLREYPEVKRIPGLYGKPIFYYRADNISDEQKEKIVDYKNYYNYGKWYVILDEAHKGDKEDSKRQHIYTILSKNGFLFNFSATFTDPQDIITTGFEFNLSNFIERGYGKHICLLEEEVKAFRDEEDFSDEAKQKVVLKSLLLLTYIKKFYEMAKKEDLKLYHNPLLLVLVNSVNEEDADLKLFLKEIEKIGKRQIKRKLFKKAKKELFIELKKSPKFMYEDENFSLNKNLLKSIKYKDVLKYVFNSETPGEMEISYRPSSKKEVLFKLKSADRHFALSKTGNLPTWLKNELDRFNVNHQFEEESHFERINNEDSPVNILIGSRAFYEGWDSNRPNIIMFINIGIGEKAKKFVLQSVGRGVRIEPIPNKRKRLLALYNDKELEEDLFNSLKDKIQPIETLFIIGTNKKALDTVIKELKREETTTEIKLFKNPATEKHTLLIPTYKTANYSLWQENRGAKFEITQQQLELLKYYVDYFEDDKVLLFTYEVEPKILKILRKTLNEPRKYYNEGEREFKNVELLTRQVLSYLKVVPEELDKFKELEDEIKHFEHIKIYFKDAKELVKKINIMKDYPQKNKELDDLFKIAKNRSEYDKKHKELEEYKIFEHKGIKLIIKHIAQHYYVPLLMSEEEKIDYLSHIIKTKSEAGFIKKLEEYLQEPNNKFSNFDWWFFSKLDETLDEVYIPYYDPEINRLSKFKPDFIFWLKKNDKYYIVFIDPKSIKFTSYEHKVNGYKRLFEENDKPKDFMFNTFKVNVFLFLNTDDVNKLSDNSYKKYWLDNIETFLEVITESN